MGGFRVYTDPARTYRQSNDAHAFLNAMKQIPNGTRRETIEGRLGQPDSELNANVMMRYAIEFTDYQQGDESVAYRMNEGMHRADDEYLHRACVLRFRDDKLIGRQEFFWTPHYTLVGS